MVKHEPELHTRLGDISGTHETDGDSSADSADLKGAAGQVERWSRLRESNS
jgi:hypothetical protein